MLKSAVLFTVLRSTTISQPHLRNLSRCIKRDLNLCHSVLNTIEMSAQPPNSAGATAPRLITNGNTNGNISMPSQHRSNDAQIGGPPNVSSGNMSQQNLNSIVRAIPFLYSTFSDNPFVFVNLGFYCRCSIDNYTDAFV